MYLITDDRDMNAFRKTSFCGFPKKEIFATIRKEILKGDPLTTARWVAEAHCSGWVAELYDCYETIAVQHIGLGNPRLFRYLIDRREVIRQSLVGKTSFLDTRNDGNIRYVLLEIAMILLESQKRPCGKLNKLKEQDLNPEACFRRLRHVETNHIGDNWDEEKDPRNLRGVYNELVGALIDKSLDHGFYWMAWLRMWEQSGAIVPSEDAPEECPVPLRSWWGWKVWKCLKTLEVPGLVNDLWKMSCRLMRGGNKKFREDCLLLACMSVCETLDTHRPLTADTGRIMSRSDGTVSDRLYREIMETFTENQRRLHKPVGYG